MTARVYGVIVVWLACAGALMAQDAAGSYSRKNSWTVFAEYSNTSSHILQGDARQRELADLGFGYARRLVRFWGSDLAFQVEVRPVMFESDPVNVGVLADTVDYPAPQGPVTTTTTVASPTFGVCHDAVFSGAFPPSPGFPGVSYIDTYTCGRRWTAVQAFSPAGVKYSLGTRHAVQLFLIGTIGYMYSSRPIPVQFETGGLFNVQYDFGAGVEFYRSVNQKRSVSLECRYHHFSDLIMPVYSSIDVGVDNLTYKVSYSFGR